MVTMEEIKKWKPLSKMESASPEVYKYRIESAYEVELPNKNLTLIPYVGEGGIVKYKYEELVALCPVTFLPDIYKVSIKFIPGEVVPELKTLKFYLMDFLSLPISHEHLASKIYKEVRDQIQPEKMNLYLDTAVRGGIKTTVKLGDGI